MKHFFSLELQPSFQSYSQGRDNNFNLLRMVGALTIMFAHAMFITIGDDINFDTFPVKYTLGITTLNLFFVLSGMLVTASWLKHTDIVTYLASRALRIFPGLIVVSFCVAFILGPLVTSLSLVEYFSSLRVWIYWPLTSLLNPDMTLPGVFEGMPNDAEVNAPLWTLRYEVLLYVGLAIIGLLGWLNRRSTFLNFALTAFSIYLIVTYFTDLRSYDAIDHLMHFGYAFLIGTCLHIFGDRIPLDIRLGIIGLALSLIMVWNFGLEIGELLLIPSAAMIGCWIAYVPGGKIRDYNGLGDYSYGLYIWHYPIEQTLFSSFNMLTASSLFLVALPVTFVIAVFSWHFIERPALASISYVARSIKTVV